MLESYLIKGLLVGLVFGVPAGAIGALSIQRTLNHGFWAGFCTGLGSSVADVLYACVGICGLTMISNFLFAHQTAISIVGGGIMIVLGVLIFRKEAANHEHQTQKVNLSVCFGSSFAIAITNPATILSFLVAFASFGIAESSAPIQNNQLILGILLGTGCWWLLLSGITAKFRSRITAGIYRVLNRLLGIVMVLLGLVMALRVCQHFL